MPSKYEHYFRSAPDWAAFATAAKGPSNGTANEPASTEPTPPSPPIPLNVPKERADLAAREAKWTVLNPPTRYGYQKSIVRFPSRDGTEIPLMVYRPAAAQSQAERGAVDQLPLLFVTHGGGWFEGSAVTEEIFFLRTVLQHFPRLLIVSVEYRLAPEFPFPTPLNDCWDALRWMLEKWDDPVLVGDSAGVAIDRNRVVLAGSSAGAALAAGVAGLCRDEGLKTAGMLLNVPVLCHPQHFPGESSDFGSYEECVETPLTGQEMRELWDLYIPDPKTGADPKASPLLADHRDLPPTYVFVAGQDPVRDEGIAYVKALESAGVSVTMRIYSGVPHDFTEIEHLESSKQFNLDLVKSVETLIGDQKVLSDR